jgi:AraC-like DNA-binding protein
MMEHLYAAATYIIYFGSGLTFMMAVEQLASRNRNKINYISAGMLACNSIINLGAGVFAGGMHINHPWATFLFLTSVFLTGPLNLFYYTALMNPGEQIPARIKGHLVPPMIVFVFEVVFQARPAAEKSEILSRLFDPGSMHAIKVAICAGSILVIAYLLYLTRETVSVWKSDRIRTETRIIVGLSVAAVAVVVFFLSGFLSGLKELILVGGLSLAGIHIFIFLAHSRHPEFFQLLKKEIREKKYRTSMLRGMDTAALNAQLTALMEEGLYRDYDLTLNSLAGRLEITPHQLSEFLNEKKRVNFANYINYYRIEEAKKLLVEDQERSIISVCFHVGFNSKSAFNNAFRKLTGVNPKDFRSQSMNKASGSSR